MSTETKDNLSTLVDDLKSKENYLGHDTVEENGKNVSKIYVKSLSDDDIKNNSGLETFSDARGSGFVLSTPIVNDDNLYKDLDNDKYQELEKIFLSGDETKKTNILDDLFIMQKDKTRITDEQKKKLIASAIPLPDKLILLKLLNDKNPQNSLGLDFKEKQEKANSKAPKQDKGLAKGLGNIVEKLGNSSQID